MTYIRTPEHCERMSHIKREYYRRHPELCEHLSRTKRGNRFAAKPHNMSEQGLASLREAASSGRSWRGGDIGDAYAAVLCPVGFVREYYLWRDGRQVCVMDFAYLSARTNIELDGPFHYATPEEDRRRDALLRSLGWRIIRIRH